MPNLKYKKGRYTYNEETEQWEWAGKTLKPGKIPMCLHEFLIRKHHSAKGSWRRPTDEKYAKPFHKKRVEEMDFGTCGCKKGIHHYVNGRCANCGKEK